MKGAIHMSRFLSQTLAEFINRLTYQDLPADVIRWVKMNLLDSLGICLYAGDMPWSKIVVKQIRELGGKEECTIIGYRKKTSRLYAALANGTLAHGLEFDNAHWSHVHPGPPTVCAALSIAEREKRSGKDLLTAIAAGFEVAVSVGKAVFPSHRYRGFQPTATIGTFGAATAAGKLMKLDEDGMINCLGLAGTQAAGLNEWIHSGDMSKRIHAGKAAMNGVLAALWAEKGLTGPISVFEGGDGFFKAYADQADHHYIEDIGKQFDLINIMIKPYATCADFHGAIRLVLQLQKDHHLKAEDIEKVWIGADTISKKYDSKKLETLLHAQMHYSVTIAIVLLEADGFIDAFLKRYQDPKVKELAERIDIVVDPEVDKAFPQKWGVKVEITTKDGKQYRGSEEDRPKMSEEEVKNKFRRLAQKRLDTKGIESIIESVDHLENVGNLSELTVLLRPSGRRKPSH
jgi:2-methylcitrate dehydratase PrpD